MAGIPYILTLFRRIAATVAGIGSCRRCRFGGQSPPSINFFFKADKSGHFRTSNSANSR
jgi:hypothetical protein